MRMTWCQCHTWTEMGAPFVKRGTRQHRGTRSFSGIKHCKACLKTKSWLLLEQDLPIHSFSTSCHEAIFTSRLRKNSEIPHFWILLRPKINKVFENQRKRWEKVAFNIASEASFTIWVAKSLFKSAKNGPFGEFFKTWSLLLNSVTRQVTFNRTKMDGNVKIQKFKWDILSNFQTFFVFICQFHPVL